MSSAAESRGWEIEDNYHEHHLDDPDVDITEYAEGHVGAFIGFVVVLAIFIAGIFGLREWLKPPVLVFPVPVVQVVQKFIDPGVDSHPHQRLGPLSVDLGWTLDCFHVNNTTRLIRPNYENPVCNGAAAKKRGAF